MSNLKDANILETPSNYNNRVGDRNESIKAQIAKNYFGGPR